MATMRQDIKHNTDLPRLAEPMEAANFTEVPKRRNVLIKDGWIYADRPDTTEENQWWKPVEAYYRGQKPYLELARCGETPTQIARFLETYGAITEERARIAPNQIRFQLSEFERERSHFAFVAELASGLKKPATLQGIFLKRLKEAAQNSLAGKPGWLSIMERIRWVLNVPQPSTSDGTATASAIRKVYFVVLLRKLELHLQQMSDKALAEKAASYLAVSISERLRDIKVRFECEADGSAKLSAECFNKLLNSFYWMLANDLATCHGPTRCAHCKRFFFADKQNVAYCPERPECKERGRRKVDWERNKDKYNRNRKRKRDAERKKRGEHAKAT